MELQEFVNYKGETTLHCLAVDKEVEINHVITKIESTKSTLIDFRFHTNKFDRVAESIIIMYNALCDCPNLRKLSVRNNRIGMWPSHKLDNLLNPLTHKLNHVEYLDFKNNMIGMNNDFYSFFLEFINMLPSLKIIDFRNNGSTIFKEGFLRSILLQSPKIELIKFDKKNLSKFDFTQTCELLHKRQIQVRLRQNIGLQYFAMLNISNYELTQYKQYYKNDRLEQLAKELVNLRDYKAKLC